jgi:hypothetical protein
VTARATRAALLLGLSLLMNPSGGAQERPVRALASTDSARYLIGDWIRVTVELRHPKGATFQPSIPDSLAGFTVLQRLPFMPVADTVTRTGIILARYDSATTVLPGLAYLASVPGDTALLPVSTNTVALTVQRVQIDTAAQARDLKPVMTIPYTLAEILMVVGAALALAAAGVGIYRYLRKKTPAPERDLRLPVLKAAHAVAYEALGALKEKRLWQQGKVKEYHSELTEILRRYLEDRFGLMALEETTAEIIEELRRMKLLPRIVGDVTEVLVRADLVKFAKHRPDIGEHDASMKAVYEVIERTKAAPSALPPPDAEGSKRPSGAAPSADAGREASHVGA